VTSCGIEPVTSVPTSTGTPNQLPQPPRPGRRPRDSRLQLYPRTFLRQPGGKCVQPAPVTAREDRPQPARNHRPGGQPTHIARGPVQHDPARHAINLPTAARPSAGPIRATTAAATRLPIMLNDCVTHLHAYRNLVHGHTQIALIWATLKAKPTDRAQAQNEAGRRTFSLELLPLLSVMPSIDVARCRPATRRGVTDLEAAMVRPAATGACRGRPRWGRS
jgi:hypothetical protein